MPGRKKKSDVKSDTKSDAIKSGAATEPAEHYPLKRTSLTDRAARRWAAYMSRKEAGVGAGTRKLVLLLFCILMLALMWGPLFFEHKMRVVNTGRIMPPVDLSREEYRLENRRLDSAIYRQSRLHRQGADSASGSVPVR